LGVPAARHIFVFCRCSICSETLKCFANNYRVETERVSIWKEAVGGEARVPLRSLPVVSAPWS
jgi:hypothetical protein